MEEKVIVVEDDAFTRLTLVATLRSQGLSVVHEGGSASTAVLAAEELRPHIAVLDLHLGEGPTGIDVARSLRRQNPMIGIVFLTSYDDPRFLNANLQPPPAGTQYLTKKSVTSVDVLIAAMKNSLVASSVSPARIQLPAFGHLTDLQVETLRLVAQGHSNAEIAKRRFVKEKSIERTIARVAKALGISHDTSQNQRVHIAKVYFRALGLNNDDHQ
ncbi:two-component system nitrate/nitrite response regulator NarL [Aurantimicrobium minutum]|uniref:response regulator transcription factor n=1 Tax=Aurantimicrobium minutum TaxID=708131 RepID=UPI0024747062|nr:response regulator transcription factor [Aurantimicrobium minutum]MDH6277124.1 two-component system nitrate/nitrite response regulator NarL [Aurantimicrobium minutum]